jgi:hypothetical protein
LSEKRSPTEFFLGHDHGSFREDPSEIQDVQETVAAIGVYWLADYTHVVDYISLPLMIPDQNRALSFPVLPNSHQTIKMFTSFHFELDTDQGVAEVIERPSGQEIDVQSLG